MSCCTKFKETGAFLVDMNYCPWCGQSLAMTAIKETLVDALDSNFKKTLDHCRIPEDMKDECEALARKRTGEYDLGEGSKISYEMSWCPEDGCVPVIQNATLSPSPSLQTILNNLHLTAEAFMEACHEDLSTALIGDNAYVQYSEQVESFWEKASDWGLAYHNNCNYFWNNWKDDEA